MRYAVRPGPDRIQSVRGNEDGIALITVLIFTFLLLIMGATFFAMASQETHQAMYREHSSEAFYLADAGVERTRGELFDNGLWRTDTTGVTLGNGAYDLYVSDTTLAGEEVLFIRSTGHVRNADRRIEVFAKLRPGIPPVWAGNDIDVHGNFCLEGHAHANNSEDYGPNDRHFNGSGCGSEGSHSAGFIIKPPVMDTDEECFPGATYYYVDVVTGPSPFATISVVGDSTITHASLGDSLQNNVVPGTPYTIEFLNGRIDPVTGKDDFEKYFDFDDPNAIFIPRFPDDSTVVVNFARGTIVDLFFESESPSALPIQATIINSRFEGSDTVEDRLNWRRWTGGNLDVDGPATFRPLNAVTLVSHDIGQIESQTRFGTADHPGLVYITRDVDRMNATTEIHGAAFALRNFISTGGPDVTFHPGFEKDFPECLRGIRFGQLAVMDLLSWKEVPAH